MTQQEFNKLKEAFNIIINETKGYYGNFLHHKNAVLSICDSGDLIIFAWNTILEDHYEYRINLDSDYTDSCLWLRELYFTQKIKLENPILNFEF